MKKFWRQIQRTVGWFIGIIILYGGAIAKIILENELTVWLSNNGITLNNFFRGLYENPLLIPSIPLTLYLLVVVKRALDEINWDDILIQRYNPTTFSDNMYGIKITNNKSDDLTEFQAELLKYRVKPMGRSNFSYPPYTLPQRLGVKVSGGITQYAGVTIGREKEAITILAENADDSDKISFYIFGETQSMTFRDEGLLFATIRLSAKFQGKPLKPYTITVPISYQDGNLFILDIKE